MKGSAPKQKGHHTIKNRNLLTIAYNNGNALQHLVNYIHIEDGAIYFTIDSQVQAVLEKPVRVPLKNIAKLDLTMIECSGWEIPDIMKANVPNWESIVNLMDDEIRESIASSMVVYTQREFLNRYEELHYEKYGEDFKY